MEEPSTERRLKPHQVRALRFIRKRLGRAGLFLAPGVGKTIVAIRYARALKRTLVVCRRDDFLTWEVELDKEGQPEPLTIDGAKNLKYLDDQKWVICSYGMLRNDKVRKKLQDQGFNCIIADESQSIKRWKTKQTKKAVAISAHIPRRIAMSGSPITNSIEDVWSQTKFIDGGVTFGTKWFTFMNRYFIKLRPPAPPSWVLKRGAKAEVMSRLAKIAIHVHEDDVLKLPPKRYVLKSVPMSPEQKRVTKQLIDEWEYSLHAGDEPVEINHVVVRLSKLRQVSGGFLYPPKDENKKPIGKTRVLKCSKMALLKSLIRDDLSHKKKLVIWAYFTEEINQIVQMLGPSRCVRFQGKMKPEDKRTARKKFAADPRVKFFVGQADSGIGMNELVVSDTSIYYSNSDRVVSRQQSERRIRRIGSEKHRAITYYDLVTEGSVDVKIKTSIDNKQEVAQEILNGIKQGKRLRDVLK